MKKSAVILTTMSLAVVTGIAQVRDTQQPPKADASMQKILNALKSSGGKPIETLPLGRSTDPEPGVTVKDMTVPGPIGDIPIHVYTP